ncbi:hypothetical protein H072_6585 [Dactylellina haptotyla CBS 200.50]|uniref:Uncharacterized protein n=1 Tax=Dactylellina haptotyla (strain CBS 200.50) TaxID=1284197 RepID=S8BWE7_DACHA|nr:hypothetical protein H072_6585 [Dactylellina haptotyla CBS 200.50]
MASIPAPKKTYDIVQQGIKELYSPANPEVDIVAIPGLGAPPLESWKSADLKNEFNWLTDRDGISKEFPRARVLLYMYQSAWSGPLKVRQFMTNLATTLLYGLKDKRKDTPRRPIVFMGHSMGGIIIAKAVSLAESRKDVFGKMFEAITGCIFFGTPFDGAHAAAVALMFAQTSEFFGLDQATHSKLLDLMKPGDEGLRDIKNDFMRLCTKMTPKIELFCFYEEKPTDWSKQAGIPFKIPLPKKYEEFVTRESATLTGIDHLGLARTHRELVKFDSFKDTVYQIVRGPLKTIINGAPLISKNRFNSTRGIDREVVKRVLGALEGVQIEKKRKRLAQAVISSSWILQEEEYQQWLSTQPLLNDTLWILGPEGKGKLGASLAAIDHIEDVIRQAEAQNSGQGASLFGYFLCDSTTEGSSAEELLKSLIRQLVNQQEVLAAYAKQFTNTQKDPSARGKTQAGLTVENLWQSLQDILTDDIVGAVYFVINNLHSMDEEADSTKKLMGFISSEAKDEVPTSRARVRWLFTSQNRHTIKQALSTPSVRTINLDDGKYGNQVQQELRLHAQKKITALGMEKGYNKALTYFAGSLIGKRAQNTQWIDITIIQLAELPTDARDLKVRTLLERIPQDLRSLLDRAWLSVLDTKDDKLEEIKEMLRTLIITYEEPTEDDLAILTGLSHDTESRAHLCELVEKCRPLLTIRKSGKGSDTIAFMNTVVKAHLLENSERLLGLSTEEIRWQHGILALRNFSHLMEQLSPSSDSVEDPTGEDESGDIPTEPSAEEENKPDEINQNGVTETEEEPQTEELASNTDMLPTGSEQDEAEEVEFEYSEDEDEDETDAEHVEHNEEHTEMEPITVSQYAVKHWLHHASKATTDIAETLSQEEEFWKPSSIVREKWLKIYDGLTDAFSGISIENLPGLHVASAIGFAELVTALIKNGHEAERDTRDSLENTPLHLAAYFGRPNIAEVLLNSGAKVDDGQEEGDQTPLAMAAFKGHCRVMIKLLNRGANPNALAEGRPVINEAIVSGNLEAVRLLVEHGALLTHDDDDDDNHPPLALSALLSDLTMFTYLLEACADKIPHKEYNKAFISSASAGRLEVTKRLLKFKHNQDTFQAALSAAAYEENWEILLLILESCEGLDCDEIFQQIAVGSEQQDRLLSAIWKHTKCGISQNTLDVSLYEAVDKEKETTVKLLLEDFNANANATGAEYGNALTAAAYDGTLEIIKMLLDHGADVNSSDGWALQIAAGQGHRAVVELLIERGANVNACIDEDKFLLGTALQSACEAGQVDITDFLLKKGADPNIGGGPETCPIIAACRKGEAEILELLINAGATIDRFGGPDMSSPLINAAGTLYKDSVERLLNAGADINLADNDGDTALIIAANVSDADLVAFLLEKGADITHVSKRNVNALQAAFNADATECVKILVEAVTRVLTALNGAIGQKNSEVERVVRGVEFSKLIPENEEESAEAVDNTNSDELPDTTEQPQSETETEQESKIDAQNSNSNTESEENAEILPTHEDMEAENPLPEATPNIEIENPTSAVPQPSIQDIKKQDSLSVEADQPPATQKESSPETSVTLNNEEIVPSPIRQNPAFAGYQDYQDFRRNQLNGSPPISQNTESTTATSARYTEPPSNQIHGVSLDAPPSGQTAAQSTSSMHTSTYSETSLAPQAPSTVSQSQPPLQLNTTGSIPNEVTLADQLQAYQSYQSAQVLPDSRPYPTYPPYQNYQTYQRPSRKPLGSSSASTPITAEPPKQEVFQETQAFPVYQNYQEYQNHQISNYQGPPLNQNYQDLTTQSNIYQDPSLSQNYHTPPPTHESQNSRLPQSYQIPPVNQPFQVLQPVPSSQTPPAQDKVSTPKSSIVNRISGYFQQNELGKYPSGKYNYGNGRS